MLPPDMARTDQIDSYLKVNIARKYKVTWLDRRSFLVTVTYLFYCILGYSIVVSNHRELKKIFTSTSILRELP